MKNGKTANGLIRTNGTQEKYGGKNMVIFLFSERINPRLVNDTTQL